MYRILICLLLSVAFGVQANTPEVAAQRYPTLRPLQQQAMAAQLTARIIGEHHYRPVALDDSLSGKIFDGYLKSLDPDRMLFTQADIEQLQAARTRLDDAVLRNDLSIPFDMFNLYVKRAVERFGYARSLLKAGFDFTVDEDYQFNREKEPWPKTQAEANDLWRKRVKNDWLQLKLAGKDDKAILPLLDKRYENFLKRMARLKSEDAFQIFMNAYTMSVDPHTNYLGPRATEDFGIAMKLSLVGIGAVLEEKDDYATIKELVPGSPAALSGKLKQGDRIVGVAQGNKGAMTDVVGWRLDDTVALIRGAPDSVVLLDVIPAEGGPDSEHKVVPLVRKKISLEDQAAKKSILSLNDNGTTRRIGVIALPTFYEDFQARQAGEKDYRSATRDVSRLLGELKAERVDAVLIDLRNNGGGSLSEAIELTGLFTGSGPVVQQRDARGDVSVARGAAPGPVWSGPMAVMINRASASASEIFAAAIQDYGRGLVIGETSFGKGTVQTMVDLDQFAPGQGAQLGDLKLTIAQFFRINGGTTQLKGVTPDIQLPSTADAEESGEASYGNGIPWMRVKPADYREVAKNWHEILPELKLRHSQRVAKEKEYQELMEDIAEYDQRRKQNLISLNEVKRRAERDARDAKLKSRGKESGASEDDTEEQTRLAQGAGKSDKKADDPLLREAAQILSDAAMLGHGHQGLASRSPGERAVVH